MGILTWLVFGILVGSWAKTLLPGKSPGGRLRAIVTAIAGAVAGGIVATLAGFGSPMAFDFRGLLIAIGGAVAVLFVHRLMVDRYDNTPLRGSRVPHHPSPFPRR